ncbi:MAG: amino acid adenylation domain-containing protein [Ginsengibacter sp.]
MQEELVFPLHPSQQDVYTDQLLDKKSPHYNIGGYIKFKGVLDKRLFYEAVSSGAKVFDAFKMRFDLNWPEPVVFLKMDYDNLELADIDFSEKENSETAAIQWMQQRFNTPFVIEKNASLYEQYLIKISNEEYWFFGKYHHLITDGYGFIVWVQYLAQKYKSLLEGDAKEFVFSNYIDEAAKAAVYKNSTAYLEDGNFWRNKISAKPKKILQEKYFNNSSKKSETYFLTLTEQQRKLLDGIEEATKIRLHHLTIAALFIYFGKTSKESTFNFGIPVHKRGSKEARNIVGMFSGIMPYKNSFRKDITLTDLLKEILSTQKEDYKYQNYLVGDLARALKVRPDEGYLFDVVINYKLLNFELSFSEELETSVHELTNEFMKYPLQLCWQDFGKQQPLKLQLDYGTAYFTRKEIELFAQRFIFILSQFPQSFTKEIGNIDIIPPAEKELISQFTQGEERLYPEKNIIELFEEQVLKTPGETALIFEEETLTYHQLNERSNQLAKFLQGKGVKEEAFVPICIERSLEMSIGILGILKAGGAYVPIDPEYPADRIEYILEDTAASIILCNDKSKSILPAIENCDVISLDGDWEMIGEQPVSNVQNSLAFHNAAYVIYTSGSTGKPKGVINEHGGIANRLNWAQDYFTLTAGDVVLQKTSFSFDVSVWELIWPLLTGAKLVLAKPGGHRDNDYLKQIIDRHSITMLHFVPSMLGVFLPDVNEGECNSINKVLCSGEALNPTHANLFRHKLPNAELHNLYGPTEAAIDVSYWSLDNSMEEDIKLVPIGKPVANTQLYILDSEYKPSPIGVPGEINIGGVQVARGYLNKPELTKEKFIEDSFSEKSNSCLYKTGDLGRWLPDGNIEYLGRIDDQVKIRGFRIELGEIESVLQQHEMIHQVAVTARENADGNKQLLAYVVAEKAFDKQVINAYLKNKLPEYMIPALFIELKELPLTSSGKVDKKALPVPDGSENLSNKYEEPSTEMERQLVQVWQEILGVEKIGINDNFFELGGHSLNAMQLTSRLHKLLNIKIDIGKIFANPSVKALASVLSLESKDNYIPIEQLPKRDYYDLSHAQKRFWVLSHFKDGSKAYNFSGAYVIEGNLNKDAFKKAIEKLIERHENLRTIFVEIDGEPRQKILSPEESLFQLKEINLQGNPGAARVIAEAKEFELAHSYDLVKGPLFRVTLFNLSGEQNVLLFSIHHIISDGWSKAILINEILNLYKTYSSGSPDNLAALPVQYKDYAAWHTSHIKNQQKYWSDIFQDAIPVMDFPTDFERPKTVSFLGESLHSTIPESLAQNLHKLATSHNMSLNNLLFSLYALLVSQYCEQDDVVVGSLSSGRSHSDIENLIGAFINFLPVRISPDKELTLFEFLEKSNQSLIEAYNHQDYPFDLMVNEMIKQRDFSRNPFFDTMVNFHSENGLKINNSSVENAISDFGISIKPYESGEEDLYQSVLDFKLDIEPSVDSLQLFLSYNSRLYSRERMETFLGNFIKLLTMATDAPNMKLDQYDSLSFEKEGLKKIADPLAATEKLLLPVNICASFVAEPLKEILDYWDKELDLNIDVSFAPYNQVFQQLLDAGSLLNSNKGLNILFIRIEDWLKDKTGLVSAEQISFLDSTYVELTEALARVNANTSVPFLIGILPVYSPGSLGVEVSSHIEKLNVELAAAIIGLSRMILFDLNKIATLYGVVELYDSKSDEVGHMPFTQEYYAAIATYLCRKINAFKGNPYKVIALDCDNTLWKGICGETGAMNVVIDENFSNLQEFVLEKHNEGFLLVLCSKNNEADVWEVFDNHPQMKLKREHIIAHRINWDIKSGNLLSIAKELNLGIDSFIFIDDSEFEVEQLSANCPDVLSITLPPTTEDFSEFLNHIWAFDTFRITEEDAQRNKRYQVEKSRNVEQEKHTSVDDFIASLNIQVEIIPLEEENIDRAVQLSLRTNQFNLNGIRKTQQEISNLIDEKNSFNRIIKVSDRFGDYGIVGLLISKEVENSLLVETFLLSCRVLGRNVEDTVFSAMQNFCILKEINSIQLHFKPTQKNMPFHQFIARTGWLINLETNNYYLPLELENQIKI